jgi:hypothetical protein
MATTMVIVQSTIVRHGDGSDSVIRSIGPLKLVAAFGPRSGRATTS